MMDKLPNILFAISATSAAVIVLLVCVAYVSKRFQFWPPPSARSWQHKTGRWFFRAILYPLVLLSVLTFNYVPGQFGLIRYGIGSIFLVVGFGTAFMATFSLGWKNAFGEAQGLKTNGWYAWSRNPVYVVTWLGLLGWGLIVNSALVTMILFMWAILYLIAPFTEEPWLEREYGDEFKAYKQKTRRFF